MKDFKEKEELIEAIRSLLAVEVSAMMATQLSAMKAEMATAAQLTAMKDEMATATQLTNMKNEITGRIESLQQEVGSQGLKLATIKNDVESQGRKLAAIESFPIFPISVRPTSQFRATARHGVVGAVRTIVGYTG